MLKLLPSLTITEEELRHGLDVIEAGLCDALGIDNTAAAIEAAA